MTAMKYLRMRTPLLVCLLVLCLCAVGPLRGDDAVTVEEAMSRFLKALDSYDLTMLWGFFDPEATVSFPETPTATSLKRLKGSDIEAAWRAIFEYGKKNSGRTTPPYVNTTPQDLLVDHISNDVAMVTFHLGTDTRIGGRTFLWKHSPNGWKIVHLHASNLTVAPR
jgi:ketosteroid isomerase-like protein